MKQTRYLLFLLLVSFASWVFGEGWYGEKKETQTEIKQKLTNKVDLPSFYTNPAFQEAIKNPKKPKLPSTEQMKELNKKLNQPRPNIIRVDIFFADLESTLDNFAKKARLLQDKYRGRVVFYFYLVNYGSIKPFAFKKLTTLKHLQNYGVSLDNNGILSENLKLKALPGAVIRYNSRTWHATLNKTLPAATQLVKKVVKNPYRSK